MEDALPNIRHLAAFSATVTHGSVTRAAQQVALTQPALTQAIASLEKILECTLFEREPTGMRPTEPALLLAPRTERALDLIGSTRVTSTQLRAFVALARAGSYAAASRASGVSPASLHRAVADLSLALGEKLVERKGRHLVLTRKGLARARNFGLAIAELRAGHAEVRAWLGREDEWLAIGAMPLSRARWLPQALVAFRTRHPGVRVSVVEGSLTELASPLRDGEIDFVLGGLREDGELDDLEQRPVFVDQPQIVMRADHPLAGDTTLDLADAYAALRDYQWILPSRQTPLRISWERMMEHGGGPLPAVYIESGSVLAIRELLLESDLLTILSRDQVRVEVDAGLLALRAPPGPLERRIGIISRKGWQPTPAQRSMLDILIAAADEVS